MVSVCFWLSLVAGTFGTFMRSSNWSVIKPPTSPGNYKRHPPPIEYGPRYLPPTEDTYQIILALRTAGILCLVYQAITICYYTIGSYVLPQFNVLDIEEEQFINTQGLWGTTKKEDTRVEKPVTEESANGISIVEPKKLRTVVEKESKELPLANTQIESLQEEIQKKDRVQSQKYPRAKKGHQTEFLDFMEQVLMEEADDEADKSKMESEHKPIEENKNLPAQGNTPDRSPDTVRTRGASKTELYTAES